MSHSWEQYDRELVDRATVKCINDRMKIINEEKINLNEINKITTEMQECDYIKIKFERQIKDFREF